uniref:Uncharacterized protein n=1 Tax=Glossina palpalis gambiensis TaxID=67801 RepID=A0A1B0B5Z5_9MUSC
MDIENTYARQLQINNEANQVFSCEETNLLKIYAQHRPAHSHPHSLEESSVNGVEISTNL